MIYLLHICIHTLSLSLGSYQISVAEDIDGDTSIHQVVASDADSGSNADIFFYITSVETVGAVVITDVEVQSSTLSLCNTDLSLSLSLRLIMSQTYSILIWILAFFISHMTEVWITRVSRHTMYMLQLLITDYHP